MMRRVRPSKLHALTAFRPQKPMADLVTGCSAYPAKGAGEESKSWDFREPV